MEARHADGGTSSQSQQPEEVPSHGHSQERPTVPRAQNLCWKRMLVWGNAFSTVIMDVDGI